MWMPGGKMKVYKNHVDTFDLMCLVEMSLQHVQRDIIFFLPFLSSSTIESLYAIFPNYMNIISLVKPRTTLNKIL